MKKHAFGNSRLWFVIAELFLIPAALIIELFSVYKTIGLVLIAVAVLLVLYKLLSTYSMKNAKRAKILKVALSVLVIICLGLFTAAEILVISGAQTDENPEAPYLIVLGAGVDGTVPSLSLSNRLCAALEYLETYPEARAIVSGGQGPGEDISEAECMRLWLIENGISEERIFKEDESTSTEENIVNSLGIMYIFSNNQMNKVAIVSSEYHLYRAKRTAESEGAIPLGVAAHTSNPILMVNYFIREALGVVYLWIM